MLLDRNTLSKRNIQQRGLNGAVAAICLSEVELAIAAAEAAALAIFTFGVSEGIFLATLAAQAACW